MFKVNNPANQQQQTACSEQNEELQYCLLPLGTAIGQSEWADG